MGKLVSVLKRVDVRGCIACTLYVMYVGVDNLQKSVIPYELPMGELVGVVERVDVRGCIVCTLHVMYVSVGNSRVTRRKACFQKNLLWESW